jgi:hypothetical protein
MKPGELGLPIPGSFPSNPTRPGNNDSNGSFLTQITNAFSSSTYAPIQNYSSLERQADPLMWEESDEETTPTTHVAIP